MTRLHLTVIILAWDKQSDAIVKCHYCVVALNLLYFFMLVALIANLLTSYKVGKFPGISSLPRATLPLVPPS
jgi:hypothetical protein